MYIDKLEYEKLVHEKKNYKVMIKNCMLAYFFGGLICVIGQGLIFIYHDLCKMELKDSQSLMSVTMILIASILSAFGVYDKIGQIAKCGSVIPITGFANSMTSSAMEFRTEGFFLGLSSNVFKLAGAIICLGTFFSFIVAVIYYIGSLI